MVEKIEIICPKCDWKPDGGAHWTCDCGHRWNTFDTAGRCPNCKKIWKDTQCPGPQEPGGCGQWSPHIDWYRNLDQLLRDQLEKVLEVLRV